MHASVLAYEWGGRLEVFGLWRRTYACHYYRYKCYGIIILLLLLLWSCGAGLPTGASLVGALDSSLLSFSLVLVLACSF